MAMTCQRCAARPATVHVTEVGTEGNHAEAHLCGLCCQEAGWSPVAVPPPVAELVAAKPSESNEKDAENGEACPSCGLRFAEYQQVNLFGCAHDWTAFEDEVGELVQRWHGAETHVGRRPGDAQPAEGDACRAELEAELAAAVSNEHYEEAASIRDRLRRLGSGA
jgi:protein arginine kinase activator